MPSTIAPPTTLFVCSLCQFPAADSSLPSQSAGEVLIDHLRSELNARDLQDRVHLTPLRCMAGCSQPCNASIAAPGKLTFILSQVSPTAGAAAIVDFCQQYGDSRDGRVPYRDRPEIIRASTAFVLPPLPTSP